MDMFKHSISTRVKEVEAFVNEDLSKKCLSDINSHIDLSRSYITGQVKQRFNFIKTPYDRRLKIVLEEKTENAPSDSLNINLFLFDSAAEYGNRLDVGDWLAISNPIVEKSPSSHRGTSNHPCHLIVNIKKQESQIWATQGKNDIDNKTAKCIEKTTDSSQKNKDLTLNIQKENKVITFPIYEAPKVTVEQHLSSSQRKENNDVIKDDVLPTTVSLCSENICKKSKSRKQCAGNDTEYNASSDIILEGHNIKSPTKRPWPSTTTTTVAHTTTGTTVAMQLSPSTDTRLVSDPSIVKTRIIMQSSSTASRAVTGYTATSVTAHSTSSTCMSTGFVADTETQSIPKAPGYIYTPLNQLKDGDVVNVYGVVKFFTAPSSTRGSDYMMIVSITDSVCPGFEKKLKCVLFRRSQDELPNIKTVGDIVRFHRIKIGMYRNELQAKAHAGFSCLVFDGDVGASIEPMSTSKNFTLTNDDKQKISSLRRWATGLSDNILMSDCFKLKGIFADTFFNTAVEVIGKAEVAPGSCYVLRVWDGTRTMLPVRKCDLPGVTWETCMVAEELAQDLSVDVWLYDSHVSACQNIKPEDMIKITNLHSAIYVPAQNEAQHPVIELVLHGGGQKYNRGITTLHKDSNAIRDLKDCLNNPDRRYYKDLWVETSRDKEIDSTTQQQDQQSVCDKKQLTKTEKKMLKKLYFSVENIGPDQNKTKHSSFILAQKESRIVRNIKEYFTRTEEFV